MPVFLPKKSAKGYEQTMSKIGVIGKRSEILTFLAAGFTVYEAESDPEAAEKLSIAVKECAILYISPVYYTALEEAIHKHSASPAIAILPLPEKNGGVGLTRLKKFTEQAVGADILFRD